MAEFSDRIFIDEGEVRRLLQAQVPELAQESLERIPLAGTDNHIFRLGTRWCVRIPKVRWAAAAAAREASLLRKLGGGFPVETPKLVWAGRPEDFFPWNWSVVEWVEGQALGTGLITYPLDLARQLAGFILALRAVPPEAEYRAGPENHFRGAQLGDRHDLVVKAIRKLSDEYDPKAMTRAWAACSGGARDYREVWLHGDLHGGNLILRKGDLSGVIDFGLAGVGDGACDLAPGWSLFIGISRAAFRDALAPSPEEWLRGAGWALSIALIALAHYRGRESPIVPMSRRTIAAVLKEFG